MNNIVRYLLVITTTISCITNADVVPYLAFRSQGINGAREMVGWQTHINKFDMDQNYGSFSVTPEFSRSFHHKRLAEALFCDALTAHTYSPCSLNSTETCCSSCYTCCCDCPLIKIQGTKVESRDPKALMAENFYLPPDYSSEVAFNPVINNCILDFNLYCGFDEWLEGLYFRLHTPLCYTQWNLNMCERPIKPGTESYDVGYFDNSFTPADFTNPDVHGLTRSQMLDNFTEYAYTGNAINNVTGITYNGLDYARMNIHSTSATRLAEITAALGYNFLLCEDYYLGLNIRAAAPTGNRPKACWLFEPIVGNGHHWELGAGMDSRWCIWRSEEEDRDFTFYLDATLTHLFKTTQIRTFDLRCKPLSRYMLAMKFTTSIDDLKIASTQSDDPIYATAPTTQFANQFIPVANLTTGPCSVSAAMQGEVVFKMAYTWKNLQWDTGYNFWGRSCLNICRQSARCSTFTNNNWGLKGDAFVYGFPTTFSPLAVSATGIPLSATEQNASIFQGTNRPCDIRFTDTSITESIKWNMNPGVDSPGLAFNNANGALATHVVGEESSDEAIWYQTKSSRNPVLLTEDDIDVQGAQTNSYSNKLFMHLSYTWQEIPDWTPYFGAGGEMEFGSQEQCCCKSFSRASCAARSCTQSCNKYCGKSCKTVSLTQWGIWLKAGFSFK